MLETMTTGRPRRSIAVDANGGVRRRLPAGVRRLGLVVMVSLLAITGCDGDPSQRVGEQVFFRYLCNLPSDRPVILYALPPAEVPPPSVSLGIGYRVVATVPNEQCAELEVVARALATQPGHEGRTPRWFLLARGSGSSRQEGWAFMGLGGPSPAELDHLLEAPVAYLDDPLADPSIERHLSATQNRDKAEERYVQVAAWVRQIPEIEVDRFSDREGSPDLTFGSIEPQAQAGDACQVPDATSWKPWWKVTVVNVGDAAGPASFEAFGSEGTGTVTLWRGIEPGESVFIGVYPPNSSLSLIPLGQVDETSDPRKVVELGPLAPLICR
jgi:hypothetical protein